MTVACAACAATAVGMDTVAPADGLQLSVPAARCAACIGAIERHLLQQDGVRAARVNLSQKRVHVITDRPAAEIAAHLAEIGYDAFPLDAGTLAGEGDAAGRDLLMRLGVAGFAMMNVMLLSVAVWSGATGATRDLFHLISAAIALPTVLFSAQPFFRMALTALRVGRLNMDVPISLAILLAAAMSLYETLHGGEHAYFDAALSLTFFLLIGRYLEHRTRAAARSAAKELAALEVHIAQRRRGHQVETVPLSALAVGDTILVPAGGRVPVDGQMISGSGHTDRSFLTGESEPVAHGAGAALHAGEINLGAPFDMRAEAVGADTRLHRIARLVETAETARNSYTSLADRAARIYAPAVHLLAFGTFIGWYVATQDLRLSINVAVAVLIITCPCALGLAVPAVSTAAISRLYRLGFLVKSGTALERLAEARAVVLDKTGTLTSPGFDFDLATLPPEALQVAKALSQCSVHPVSAALDRYLGGIDPARLTDVSEVPGKGVKAMLDAIPVALGRASWLGGAASGLVLQIGPARHALAYSECIKPGAASMVAGLCDAGLPPQIISGDTEDKTARLAASLGVSRHVAAMSPEDKERHIAALSKAGQRPCMIGDGLNDTIALAAAHASVAPGTALDAARNAADVVLIGDSLHQVPKLFTVARQAVRLSRQNFGIALAYNAVAIPIAVLGYASPLMAALAMSMSSICVLLNALRVGRVR